jgi:hypothetical protein
MQVPSVPPCKERLTDSSGNQVCSRLAASQCITQTETAHNQLKGSLHVGLASTSGGCIGDIKGAYTYQPRSPLLNDQTHLSHKPAGQLLAAQKLVLIIGRPVC